MKKGQITLFIVLGIVILVIAAFFIYARFLRVEEINLENEIIKLQDLNVASLKIEGRLKNPGWVKEITSIYRKSLDDMEQTAGEQNLNNLRLFSGRELSEGFISGTSGLTSFFSALAGGSLFLISLILMRRQILSLPLAIARLITA